MPLFSNKVQGFFTTIQQAQPFNRPEQPSINFMSIPQPLEGLQSVIS